MFRQFHADLILKFQKQFNLSNYSMLWVSYFEGIIFGLLIGIFLF